MDQYLSPATYSFFVVVLTLEIVKLLFFSGIIALFLLFISLNLMFALFFVLFSGFNGF